MRNPIHRIHQAYVEEYALPCVEPDEPAAVVRLNHEEEYRGNDRDVSQHSGDVIGESRTGAGGDDHAAPSACCACSCAIGNLCATHVAKRHEVFSELEIGNPRSVARMRSAQRCGKVTESSFRGNLTKSETRTYARESLNCGCLLLCEVTYQWEFKHLAL